MSLAIALAILLPAAAFALPADHYAASSRLASGKWVKVRVKSTGIQFISNSDLNRLGFSDPSKVSVFGFGGRLLSSALTQDNPDDLPRAPFCITPKGLYFFGYDHVLWTYSRLSSSAQGRFSHSSHPYAEESWYFLTDSAELPEMETISTLNTSGTLPVVDSFTELLLHEEDLVHPSNTGSRYLGEDFRSPTKRTFDFRLPYAVDGMDATLVYTFGSNTSSTSSLEIKATGENGQENFTSALGSVTGSEMFMSYLTSRKTIKNPGSSLRLELEFKGSGTIKMARLDYIEVQYRRHLNLNEGQLHFRVEETSPSRVQISGADSSTIVWDITDASTPKRVEVNLASSTLSFISPGGYREYVAFTTEKTGLSIAESAAVTNQDIHSLPVPDMLIIAPNAYKEAANRLAAHHRDFDGMKVEVLTPDAIYNEFSSGTPDVTAFRRVLKMWYDRGSYDNEEDKPNGRIKFCVIMGNATPDNKLKMDYTRNSGVHYVPIWQSPTGESGTTSYSTDDYIGMLEDVSSFDIGRAKIQVAVGRLPFLSASEALTLVDKYIRYATKSEIGSWRNRFMFIADDQNNGDHLTQSEDMIRFMSFSDAGRSYRYERVYLDSFPLVESALGPSYPQARERMFNLWNSGVSYINYIGHANPSAWTHENLLTWSDITTMSNSNLPFLYAATCEFGRIDAETRSGAEELWASPEAGVIGILTPNRTVYIDQNGKLSREMAKAFFTANSEGKAKTVGEIMIDAKNNYPTISNTNKLRYVLIGNPAIKLPMPERHVVLTSIDGVDRESISADNKPELKARTKSTIEGIVAKEDDTVDETFSGQMEILLYDAERTVETYGNGDEGVVSYYNDRQTLLFKGLAKVENGHWKTDILIPAEISNNFSPAQLTFYAYTNERREANGQFSNFYVYGVSEEPENDTEGPVISLLALNREDYQAGQAVHTSPVVLARFSDPSGINISNAGIGHSMSLVLDDRTYFTDINDFYTPDSDDITGGSITYPLTDIEPGKHTLKLTVWDNAKNSSTASIDFEVAVAKSPEIYELYTDVNPARDRVNFILSTDRPKALVNCMVEVFDLNGRRVWNSASDVRTDLSAALSIPWNLCDASGVRVPRGIYLYRATVISPEGPQATKSYKLAVTAP